MNTNTGNDPGSRYPSPSSDNLHPRSGSNSLAAFAVFVIAGIVILFGVIRPFSPVLPEPGLDPSWMAVLGEAAAQKWQWGRDIVFTFGPAVNLSTKYFTDGYFQDLALQLFVIIAVSACFAELAVAGLVGRVKLLSSTLLSGALVALPFSSFGVSDAFFLSAPLLIFLLNYCGRGHLRQRVVSAFGACALGILAMSKLSLGVAALGMLLAADLTEVAKGRLSLLTVVFISAAILTYVSLGQDITYFIPLIVRQIEVVSGYAPAMSVPGSQVELIFFLCFSILIFCVLLSIEIPRFWKLSYTIRFIIFLGGIGFYWLLVFKAGFVRHDLHSLISWQALGLATLFYGIARLNSGVSRRASGLALLGLCTLVLVVPGRWALAVSASPRGDIIAAYKGVLLTAPQNEFTQVRSFLSSPSGWLKRMELRKVESLDEIHRKKSFPSLSGSVDIIPSEQSAVIAQKLEYKPRPIFQEYTSYTPMLLELNRAYFASDSGPDWVLFSPGSIDGRHPALADGRSWPEFLRRYKPEQLDGKSVVLKRRDQPVQEFPGQARTLHGQLGRNIPLPGNQPLFAQVKVQPTLFGRLMTFLYRPPVIAIVSVMGDGSKHRARLIPGIAEAGFVLSPLITDAASFTALAAGGEGLLKHRELKALRIEVSPWSTLAFRDEVEIVVHPMDLHALKTGEQTQLSKSIQVFSELLRSSGQDPNPFLNYSAEGLFAHAPSKLTYVSTFKRLSLGFGIRDGVQSIGSSDGVCFRISNNAGNSDELLWERCLRPREIEADRGIQTAEIELRGDTEARLVLETTCRGNCDGDWSYWNRIDLN